MGLEGSYWVALSFADMLGSPVSVSVDDAETMIMKRRKIVEKMSWLLGLLAILWQ